MDGLGQACSPLVVDLKLVQLRVMSTSNSAPTRLTDKAKQLVIKALKEDHSRTKEHVIWDVSVAVFPDPSATDPTDEFSASLAVPPALVPLPTLVIYLEIPGVTPDTSIYISPILPPFQLTEESVTRTIDRALASLRTKRDQLAMNSLDHLRALL